MQFLTTQHNQYWLTSSANCDLMRPKGAGKDVSLLHVSIVMDSQEFYID